MINLLEIFKSKPIERFLMVIQSDLKAISAVNDERAATMPLLIRLKFSQTTNFCKIYWIFRMRLKEICKIHFEWLISIWKANWGHWMRLIALDI